MQGMQQPRTEITISRPVKIQMPETNICEDSKGFAPSLTCNYRRSTLTFEYSSVHCQSKSAFPLSMSMFHYLISFRSESFNWVRVPATTQQTLLAKVNSINSVKAYSGSSFTPQIATEQPNINQPIIPKMLKKAPLIPEILISSFTSSGFYHIGTLKYSMA